MEKEKIREFYNLDVWKKAHALVLDIYEITKKFPEEERYGLVVQMRRAASSITANIAEGFGRYHYKDKINFYYHSRGSVTEVQNFLLIAKDLKYLNGVKVDKLIKDFTTIHMMINGLIRSIEQQN